MKENLKCQHFKCSEAPSFNTLLELQDHILVEHQHDQDKIVCKCGEGLVGRNAFLHHVNTKHDGKTLENFAGRISITLTINFRQMYKSWDPPTEAKHLTRRHFAPSRFRLKRNRFALSQFNLRRLRRL
jgi:hypothetical protein